MRLRDFCWTLNRTEGISRRTVSEATRGDCSVEEFFATEAEAWDAEASRAQAELDRANSECNRLASRMKEAQRKAAALRAAR